MSDQVNMRKIVISGVGVVEFPDDDFNYSFYKIDGYLLIYRSQVIEDGSMSEKFLWEKRKCT